MPSETIRFCLCGCGREYRPRKNNVDTGYFRGHHKYIATCGYCDKSFEVKPGRLEKRQVVYCSHKCGCAARTERSLITLTCEICGEEFSRKSFKVKNHNFCSLSCSKQYVAYLSSLRDKRIEVHCANCGNQLLIQSQAQKRNKFFYCNQKCRSEHILGENNPAYTSGLGRRGDYGKNWKKQRNATLKRDGFSCKSCGTTPLLKGHLHVHHIIPVFKFSGDWEKANALSNLITLCLLCHKKIELGKLPVPEI